MSFRKKISIALICLVFAWVAGSIANIVAPEVATAEGSHSNGSGQSKEPMALTLLGQARINLDSYLWLRTEDYLNYGITHNSYTKESLSQYMIRQYQMSFDIPVKDVPSAPPARLRRDWRGVFAKFDSIFPVKGVHGDPRELLPWYRTQTALNPLDTNAYLNGAFFLADFAGKPDEALAFLKEGEVNNPNSPAIHLGLGRLYYDKWKKLDQALPHLEKAVAFGKRIKSPNDEQKETLGNSYLYLARTYRGKGDLGSALRVAEEGVAACPDHALVRIIHRVVIKDIKERNQGPGQVP